MSSKQSPSASLELALPRRDRVVATLCLVTCAVLLVALQRVNGSATRAADSVAVGHASFVHEDVRLRGSDSLVWERLRSNDAVYGGDAVFVGAESYAAIKLDDGTRLDLDPSTLVVIGSNDGRIELSRGGISAQSAETPVTVSAAGGELVLDSNGGARIRVDGGEAIFNVERGSASVRGSGEGQTLGANQSASVAGSGELSATRSWPVRLVEPPNGARIPVPERGTEVDFAIRSEQDGSLFLQVGATPGLESRLVSLPIGDATIQWPTDRTGPHYWRIIDSFGEARSETRVFMLVQDVAPQPILPAPRQHVASAPGKPLRFEWTEISGATTYEVQLAELRSFGSVLHEVTVDRTRTLVRAELADGTYFWRVRAVGGHQGPYSEPSEFRLAMGEVIEAPTRMGSREVETGRTP